MVKLEVYYRADEYISHGDEENLSTITPFRRQKVMYEGDLIEIPIVTGNSVRGKLRRIASKRLLDILNVKSLSPKLYHVLFTGGALTDAEEVVDVGFIKKTRRLLPCLSLFGAAVGNVIISGRISVGFVFPIGKETEKFTGEKSEHSVFEFLELVFYTRKEDYEHEESSTEISETAQMKYEIETLVPGTRFKQYIVLATNDEIELACFRDTWEQFAKDPRLGGQSRVGHGRVTIEHVTNLDSLPSSEKYLEYVQKNAQEIKEFLNALGG